MNTERRDRLRDAAIEVLAQFGARGLTHRAVDDAAGVPPGTAKNYFPTRDALLRAVADRCLELYRAVPRPEPGDRDGLAAMLITLLANVAGPGRSRMLAYVELRSEAARKPWLAVLLDEIAAADFDSFAQASRSAGLPVTRERATVLTLALHGAIPHLLAGGRETLAAAGLDDLDRFVADLVAAVFGDEATVATRTR